VARIAPSELLYSAGDTPLRAAPEGAAPAGATCPSSPAARLAVRRRRWASASCWSSCKPPACRPGAPTTCPRPTPPPPPCWQYAEHTQGRALTPSAQHARAAQRRADRPAAHHPAQPGAGADPARRGRAHAVLAAGHLHDRHGQPPAQELAAGAPARPAPQARRQRLAPSPRCAATRRRPVAGPARASSRAAATWSASPPASRCARCARASWWRCARRYKKQSKLAPLHGLPEPFWLIFRAHLHPAAGLRRPAGARHPGRARRAGARRRRDRHGFDAELDELRAIQTNCDAFLLDLETREKAPAPALPTCGCSSTRCTASTSRSPRASSTRCPTTTAAARR
jgi:DNA mismatch repair protein MutS